MRAFVLFLLVGVTALSAADAATDLEPPAGAKASLAKSVEAARKQYQAYQTALRKETEKLLKDLDGQLVAATKKGDLDSALAIKGLIAKVNEGLLSDESQAEFDALGNPIARKRWRDAPVELLLAADDKVECRLNGEVIGGAGYERTESYPIKISSGDVLTCKVVDTGGDFGLFAVLRDKDKKNIASPTAWKAYKPAKEATWWELDRADPTLSAASVVDSTYLLRRLKDEGEPAAQVIWGSEKSRTVYLALLIP